MASGSNFGAPPAAAGGGAPAPSVFGGATAGAPAAPTPAAAAPAGGFNLAAAAAPTTTATPAPATGFAGGFGGTSTTPAAPAPVAPTAPATTAAPAPVFGGAAAASTATTTTTGGVFGGTTAAPTPAAPAPASVFGGAPAAPAAPAQPQYVKASVYEDRFPGQRVQERIAPVLLALQNEQPNESSLQAEELVHLLTVDNNVSSLGGLLLREIPKLDDFVPPNASTRQQLSSQFHVHLSEDAQPPLTQDMLNDIFTLATDLRLSEADAISLYAAASQQPPTAQAVAAAAAAAATPNNYNNNNGMHVVSWARQLYFGNRTRLLETVLKLVQQRVAAAAAVAAANSSDRDRLVLIATDGLLRHGLVTSLIQLVRQATRRVDELQGELVRLRAANTSSSGAAFYNYFGAAAAATPPVASSSTSNHQMDNLQHHLQYTVQQRQMAAECLFFIAYHTQLQVQEVVDLITLIKDLTNGMNPVTAGTPATTGLVLLDPLDDVPATFEVVAGAAHHHPWMQQPPPLQGRDKDPLQWQAELVQQVVQTGQTALLRTVGTLQVTVLAAMDTKTVLMDRTTHQPNSFGEGNALLPPGSSSTDALAPLHACLDKDTAANDWKRKDILGLLMASYAILLRTSLSPSVLVSPRVAPIGGAGAGTSSMDVRKSWRACMDAPCDYKSFSFGRLCLVPALQMPASAADDNGDDCDVSEFCLSVLAEFAARFLDVKMTSGDRPVSRAKWEQDANEDLRLRRSQQEQDRQFQATYGTHGATTTTAAALPDFVDLLLRPDCNDDMYAFATALCALGPEYALPFWSRGSVGGVGTGGEPPQPTTTTLVPSGALLDLWEQQSSDDTLRPTFLSFLAALALARNEDGSLDGARTIHEMFCEEQVNNDVRGLTWPALIELLRWYAHELRPNASSSSGSSNTTAASRAGGSPSGSTEYYYFATDDNNTSTSVAGGASSAESSASRSKSRELGEFNTYNLLSHLALISNVASSCPAARSAILSVGIPVRNTNATNGSDRQAPAAPALAATTTAGNQESVLVILFSLAVAPVPPDVRGELFRTIAELISLEGVTTTTSHTEQQKQQWADEIRKAAVDGWELLDLYQILPIHLLEQYQSVVISNPTDVKDSGLAFPPSSTSLAGSRPVNSWLPAESRHSILYEMEHVESALGVYASTGGFLCLLKSLFTVGGCPANLGSKWRLRPGCTPYIEYVIHLVLPRATGKFSQLAPLPFRTLQDRSTLVALACEVTEVVLASYVVPSPQPAMFQQGAEMHGQALSTAEEKLGLPGLARAVVREPPYLGDGSAGGGGQLYHDFDATAAATQLMIDAAAINGRSSGFGSAESPRASSSPSSAIVPRTGSFTGDNNSAPMPDVPPAKSPGLTILLTLLSSPATPLLESLFVILSEQRGHKKGGFVSSDDFALAHSLFVATPPSFGGAKRSNRSSSSSRGRRYVTLEALRPVPTTPTSKKSMEWGKRSVLATLRVLCAVVVREQALQSALSASFSRFSLIPTLRFKTPPHVASQLKEFGAPVETLSQHMEFADIATPVVPGIVSCLHSRTSSVDIASAATALIFNLESELGPQKGFDLLARRRDGRFGHLAQAFGMQLILCSKLDQACPATVDLMRLTLEKLLEYLRTPYSSGTDSFVQALLGLPSDSDPGLWSPNNPGAMTQVQDCFEAVLRLLKSGPCNPRLVPACYEVVHRLCALNSGDPVSLGRSVYSSTRVRSLEFWRSHLLLMLYRSRQSPQSVDEIHSLAWILKGIAEELRLLSGAVTSASTRAVLPEFPTRQLTQFQDLLEVLIDPQLNVIQNLMAVVPIIEERRFDGPAPPAKLLNDSTYQLKGASEVVDSYEIVDGNKLCMLASAQGDHVQDTNGYRAWSDHWNASVGKDCASSHLTSAIYIALGSASVASTELASHLPRDAGPWLNVLSALLGRLENQSHNIQYRTESLDEGFFTTATRNLALATFSVAMLIKSSASNADTARVWEACLQVMRVITLSGADRSGGQLSARKMERTTAFASALALLIPTDRLSHTDFGDYRTVQRAGVVLAQLAVGQPNPSVVPYQPEAAAVVSRSCLGLLLSLVAGKENGEFFCRDLLTHHLGYEQSSVVAAGLIGCIRVFDADILSLLLTIAAHRSGGDVLIEQGVLETLTAAASAYRAEENGYVARSGPSIQAREIATPDFFQGHLQLLSTLMISQQNDHEKRERIINGVTAILSQYASLIERLVVRFPREGNVCETAVKCFALLHFYSHSRTQSVSTRALISMDQLASKMQPLVFGPQIVQLALHIAENPLPPSLRQPLPSILVSKEPVAMGASLVATTTMPTKSWWDGQDTSTGSKEEICRLAALALGMARDGLCSARRSPSSVDTMSLLRALCRCMDAHNWTASVPQGQTYSLHSQLQLGFEQSDYVMQFRSKLSDFLEDVLILVLTHLRHDTHGRYAREVVTTLNHVGFTGTDSQALRSLSSDENKLDHTRELVQAIREEAGKRGVVNSGLGKY